MQEQLNKLKEKEFDKWIKEVFIKIQNAWNENKINALVPLESGILLERDAQKMQILELEGKREVRKDTVVHYVDIYHYEKDGNVEIVKALVKATLENYIYQTGTNEVVEGIRDYNITKIYRITLKKRYNFGSELGKQIVNCKACNAKVDLKASGKCTYCGTMVYTEDHDWAVVEIEEVND